MSLTPRTLLASFVTQPSQSVVIAIKPTEIRTWTGTQLRYTDVTYDHAGAIAAAYVARYWLEDGRIGSDPLYRQMYEQGAQAAERNRHRDRGPRASPQSISIDRLVATLRPVVSDDVLLCITPDGHHLHLPDGPAQPTHLKALAVYALLTNGLGYLDHWKEAIRAVAPKFYKEIAIDPDGVQKLATLTTDAVHLVVAEDAPPAA